MKSINELRAEYLKAQEDLKNAKTKEGRYKPLTIIQKVGSQLREIERTMPRFTGPNTGNYEKHIMTDSEKIDKLTKIAAYLVFIVEQTAPPAYTPEIDELKDTLKELKK